MPVLTPSSGTMYDKNGSNSGAVSGYGDGGDNQDRSGSPEQGHSNGPTPNSSNGGGSDSKSHLAPGPMHGGNQENGFHPSPISPQQSMMNQPGPMDANNPTFFADPNFSIGHGMAGQPPAGFAMPTNGWTDMSGQAPTPGMTPVGEGVLRALMNMGPMDAMDLSSWDSGHDNAMRG